MTPAAPQAMKVTILGLYNSMATTIFGPMDILNQAGRLWNRLSKTPQTPFFQVAIASPDGKPIQCLNKVRVQPHCGVSQVEKTDLIVIASASYIEEILGASPGLVPWLRRQYQGGAHLASICTGSFLLAETGLLDGKSATVHWGFADTFNARYPQVELRPDKMFIDHGRLYCSAGVNAGLDLSLYLVEKFCGREHAVHSAKTMILDMGRESQTPYLCYLFAKDHGDAAALEAQNRIEERYTRAIDFDGLAEELGLSRRSLERRFKRAAKLTPLGYQQQLRVEAAKRLLEAGGKTFSAITYLVGYEDVPFFRKLFMRMTGLPPKEYQRRFGGYAAQGAARSQ